MFTKFKLSLSRINYKLYIALLILGLTPTIYNTVRVFFLASNFSLCVGTYSVAVKSFIGFKT